METGLPPAAAAMLVGEPDRGSGKQVPTLQTKALDRRAEKRGRKPTPSGVGECHSSKNAGLNGRASLALFAGSWIPFCPDFATFTSKPISLERNWAASRSTSYSS